MKKRDRQQADEAAHADLRAEKSHCPKMRALIGLEQLIAAQQPQLPEGLSQQIVSGVLAEIGCIDQDAMGEEFAVGVDHSPQSDGHRHSGRRDHLYHRAAPARAESPKQSSPEHSASLRRLWLMHQTMLMVNLSVFCFLMSFIWSSSSVKDSTREARVIPEGHVIVSMEVPLDSARLAPFERVDLKVSIQEESGQEIIHDLGHYLAVHRVEPVHSARSRVSLVMPKEQAAQVRYARILGELEISPVALSSKIPSLPQRVVHDPAGRKIEVAANQMPAVLYYHRSRAGNAERLVYQEGAWVEDPQVRIRAF